MGKRDGKDGKALSRINLRVQETKNMIELESCNPRAFWDERFRRYGHTGDTDGLIYRYDQPLRLRLIDKALSRSKVQIGKYGKILDIGCGTGDLISLLLKKGTLDITGIDFSDEVISFVRRRFSANTGVRFFVTDVEDMDFPASSFNLVTCVNVLQHINDEKAFFKTIKNILGVVKFGGHILTMDFSPAKVKNKNAGLYLVIRSKTEYVEAFENNGCSLIGEYGLPRLGVRSCRGISRLATGVIRLLPKPKMRTVNQTTVGTQSAEVTFKYQLYDLMRATVLKLATPFDYFLVPFPYRYTDMGILIFKKPELVYKTLKQGRKVNKSRVQRSKVCILTSVHPVFDARIFHKQAKALIKAGYDVTLIAQHDKDEAVGGVKIVALPKPKNRYKRVLGLTFRVLRLALSQRADIYHFHDPELILVGVFLRLMGEKVIYDVHEDYYLSIQGRDWVPKLFRKSVALGFNLVEQFSTKMFDSIVVTTPDVGKKFPSSRTVIVRNMPILEMLDSAEPLNIKKERPVAIYVGYLSKIRGIKEIIQAIGLLEGKVELWLLGEFDDRFFEEEIKEMPQFKFVKYLGHKSIKDIYRYVKTADLGLNILHPLPNYLTALSTKVFEYMACSIPVLASNFPLWKEILEGKKVGMTTDPLNPQDIAEKVEWLTTHREETKEMGRRGRELVEKEFCWKKEEDKLISFYHKVSNC